MITFKDVFRKSFLEGYAASGLTVKSIVITLSIACLFALYVFVVYRMYTRKTFYSKSFNISLAALTLITTSIILTIQSSIVVSLGMVGALSIVRFRTAIKDPMDLIFLFWAISNGIICGAGLAGIAVASSALLTIGIYVLELIPVAKAPMILVVNASEGSIEKQLLELVKHHSSSYKVKSRILEQGRFDVIIEVRLKEESELLKQVGSIEQVRRCSLMAHDGEVTF